MDNSPMERKVTDTPQRPQLYRDLLLLPVFALVVAADQVTKALVRGYLRIGESVPDEGPFRITYTTNTGAAFGIFSDQTVIMTIASFIGIGILLFFYHSHPGPERLVRLSLGLLLGGAVGNLMDRIRLGRVTDFIDVGAWPIFNLADSAIVTGIVILVVVFLFERDKTAADKQGVLTNQGFIADEDGTSNQAEPVGNDD